jgi:hypothetical protein
MWAVTVQDGSPFICCNSLLIMLYLRPEELEATWKWLDTWLESLPDDFEGRETLCKLVDELFRHIDSQQQIISDLKRIEQSFGSLKQEIRELKGHTRAKKGKPLLCTQEQVRYGCGHSKDGEFIKCLEHDGTDEGCSDTNIEYVDIKTSRHACRACIRRRS